MTATPTRTRDAHGLAKRRKVVRGELYNLEADAIKALAHPKRLQIIDLLSDGSERTVTELQEDTRLSQSNVSQNLSILRASGIVQARRDGNNVYYSVTDPRVLKAVTLLRAVLETRIEDHQFLVERKAAKTKENVKRTATYAVVIGLGLFGILLFGAAAHPLLVGGELQDVGAMAVYMTHSPGLDAVIDTCLSVSSSNPAGLPPPTATF